MKNKRNIILLIVLLCVLLITIIFNLPKKNNIKNVEYDYTNKIFSSSSNEEDNTYATIVIFTKNGKYYHFTNTHDEGCILRASSGIWKKNKDDNIYVKYDKAIFYDGGELVETDEPDYFNLKRINYQLIKINYPYDALLNLTIKKSKKNDIYKNYITIDDITYYPIYEFKTEKDLYKKLEEMYGEVYTMLVDDNIEAIDYTI